MKRILLILLCVWGVLYSQAQKILTLHTGYLSELIEPTIPTRDVEQIEDGFLVTYHIDKVLIQPDPLFPGKTFCKINGFGMNESSGEPCTLLRNDWIAIPTGYSAKVEVVDSAFVDYQYELTPARQPLLNSSNEIYTKQNVLEINPYNGFKPNTIASMSGVQTYRGHSLCQATISPIQYNYNTRTIRLYTSITYKVTFLKNNMNNVVGKAVSTYISCEDKFLNNNVIGGLSNTRRSSAENTAISDIRDYLILSTNAYSASVNRFAKWKRLLGFNVHIILRDDWTCSSVKNAITDVYTENPSLYYLLIVGDHDDVPAQTSSHMMTHVTDFYYGCMDDDLFPEIYRGRLSVSTKEEADNVIDKIIRYEQNPPSNTSFYNNGLHCAYFQDDKRDGYADRRFAQTSEDVRSYVITQGKTIQRVYKTPTDVTPLYWNKGMFSNGEAIPDDLRKPNFAWNGNANDISNAINNGVFYVLHRDHGGVGVWRDPSFSQQDISNLSNGNLLPVIFSMNCDTGTFNENCFAETFLRKANGGCVAIYGASATSYSGYNDALTTGMFDAIWPVPGLSINIPKQNDIYSPTPSPTYTLGQILGQGMIRMIETYNTGFYAKYTNEIFHCFGDPSMQIYTECPIEFTDVSVVRNAGNITIDVGANETARITVYDPIEDNMQSYIGNIVTVPTLNSDEAIVCVSAHNRIPFIQISDVAYIQNINITGTLEKNSDVIKVGNHVTSSMPIGDVTTNNADITLRAKKVVLDKGTYISTGSKLRIENH